MWFQTGYDDILSTNLQHAQINMLLPSMPLTTVEKGQGVSLPVLTLMRSVDSWFPQF